MTERWEEGFDTWSPRSAGGGAGPPAEADAEVDRGELLRLARELAAQRDAEQRRARTELEQLKESLRARAAAVAERERELADLQRQLERGKPPRRQPAELDPEALAARERAALERLQAVEARERELEQRAAALASESAQLAEREEALRAELEAARTELERFEADRQLAAAERERLEERLEEARTAERELAALRLQLERERERIEARERAAAARAAPDPEQTQPEPHDHPRGEREAELRRLEARLDARERELALVRQGLDAQRIELRERERALRRRDLAEARQAFEAPLSPPSFGEGLAAFVASRSRR